MKTQTINPYHKEILWAAELRELKRAVVYLGSNGNRKSFRLAQQLFADIPELREA